MKLRRELGLFEAVVYGVGVIVGAGVFALIGQAAGSAGNSLWLSFLISALVAIFTGLSYAELSAMYPKSVAEFIYVKKAYGSEFWAFIIGWLLIFTGIVGVATVSLGFSGYFFELFSFSKELQSPITILVAIALTAILSFINFLGIKESSNLNIIFTSMEIIALIIIIILGVWKISYSPTINYFEMPKGFGGVFSASIIVFFAYVGFEDVVNISEETKSPKKLIPLALLLSIAITTFIYILTSISAVNLASWQELSASQAPLALAASKVLGSNAFIFISVAALMATAGTSLLLLVATSRVLYGMANEGSFPRILARVHSKKKTPYIAVVAAMLVAICFVLVGNIESIAKVTSLGSLIAFCAVNLSLIHLRFNKPEIPRPFKTPLNIGKFPVIAFLGVISCMILMGYFELEMILFSLVVILAGAVFFVVFKMRSYRKKR